MCIHKSSTHSEQDNSPHKYLLHKSQQKLRTCCLLCNYKQPDNAVLKTIKYLKRVKKYVDKKTNDDNPEIDDDADTEDMVRRPENGHCCINTAAISRNQMLELYRALNIYQTNHRIYYIITFILLPCFHCLVIDRINAVFHMGKVVTVFIFSILHNIR